MVTPANWGWGNPQLLDSTDMVLAQVAPDRSIRVRNADVGTVAAELVRRLHCVGWTGPDPIVDEWGYARRLMRSAEDKYRALGLTEARWLPIAAMEEWSRHAWGTAIDLDTTVNPMYATRPTNPQAHTTMPLAFCPAIATDLLLEHGAAWLRPWDPQHWQVADGVTPARIAALAGQIRRFRMADVLDYSGGWPTPAQIKAAEYGGIVRYIGTPGRGKNLTKTEANAMKAGGIPIALVYEDDAGWMRGGTASGAAAARASLADAAACGVPVRCVYFACDEDVTSQMSTVMACLDGAAGVLGKARVGVYGEADVVDAAVPAHAAWGWQTRAWSGGRVSGKACLLQQIGYVTVGGTQCDRNTVLKDDWGQTPYEGDDVALTAAEKTEIAEEVVRVLDVVAQYTHGAKLDNFFRRSADIHLNRGGATATQVQAVATALASNASSVSSGIIDTKSAILGALAAIDTSHFTSAEIDSISAAIAARVEGLSAEQTEAALRHVFAAAGEPLPIQPD